MRDNQKSKVYRWERPYEKPPSLSLDECRELVEWAYLQYGLRFTGRIADGRGTRVATGSIHRVSLPLWARNSAVTFHEAAHGIVATLYRGKDVADHGPEFTRILIELMARHKLARLPELRESAREFKLKVSAEAACIPISITNVKKLEAMKAHIFSLREQLREAETELTQLNQTK